MTITQRVQELRSGFTPTFWIANILELFERLAFYGAKAILVIFLAERVGLKEEAGTLAGTFTFVLYFLPIFAGVFVDKYGFRKSLMSCFFIFAIGYFLIGLAGMDFGQPLVESVGKKLFVIIGLMITAIGGSLIKPCIVGTVALTSKPDFKAYGFSIYYTLVNIGGAIGPILAIPVRKEFGIEFVLVTSSITSALMLLGTFLFFKEPQPQDGPLETKTFGKVFSDMMLVFANLRFMLFLIIFSGFWLMFWNIFYLLPFYVQDVLKYENFELIETVDAFCIIFLTIPVTAMVKKFKPFTAMTLGFLIASLSWIVMGSFLTITATVIAVAIYAVGEAIQSPRYYEYVSNLAPKGQIGTFMGFAFLPVAIGALGAGVIADYLKNNFLESNPSYMWFFLSGLGIVATTLMVLYNLFIAPKQVKQ
jgi:proton-dependent oligopeptide transporter, POT family